MTFFTKTSHTLKTCRLLLSLLSLFLFSFTVSAQLQKRGQIITTPIAVMDPNGDGFVSKTTAGFSNDGDYLGEFELPMFGIPKVADGEVDGDNVGNPCGITDLIPDKNGFSVYAFRDANNNLICRFRVGDNNPSVEAWTLLLDTDGLFGPGKDPNATADNPGFELDITLIKRNNAGILVYNIDGVDKCGTPILTYPIATHFQISVGDEVSCGDPDYFYDFYVPFAAVATAFNASAGTNIDASTGLRYVAVTNTSATCAMDGKIADISGLDNDDPLYKNCDVCAFTAIIENQCPTPVNDLCATCLGFNASLPAKPTINQPLRAGQTIISGTSSAGTFIKLSVYARNGGTDASPTWQATPREEQTVVVQPNGAWSVTLNSPLLAYDKIVAKAQLTIDGSGCDSSDDNTTSTSVTVVNPNVAPVAQPQTVEVIEDTPKVITLVGTDSDVGDVLTYQILTAPAHGTLSCSNCSNPTYTPALNYIGPDSFTFQVSDGVLVSNIATVTINVQPVNDLPVANDQSVTTEEDTPKAITLTATDADGNTLTYIIVTPPAHGSLSGTGANVTYTPALNYTGPDSFTFKVNDGTADSNTATVSITVTPINDAPTAQNQVVIVNEDESVVITLVGSDPEGSALIYTIVSGPSNGTLTGSGSTRTYTPNPNYNGPDSFTFKVNDGSFDSNIATVSISVTPINDAPVAVSKILTTPEDTPLPIILSASDVDDGTTLVYTILTQPTNGTLTGLLLPGLTYVPNPNFVGTDSFTFMVDDGRLNSNIATITINVTPVNDAPVANAQSILVPEDTATPITLTGTDLDGNALSYIVVTAPTHGILSGTGPNLIYTPNANYNGPDSFTFKVNDGTVDSNIATVTITVTPVNDAPIANNQSLTTPEDTPLPITLTATDVDTGDVLTYSIVTPPANGTLSVVSGAGVTYTPNLDFVGNDSFTFKANDGTVDSNIATILITVTPLNDAPVADDQVITTPEDTPVSFTITGSDAEGSGLTYVIVSQPAHGTLSGTAPNLTYLPDVNYVGPDSFTFKVNDGTTDSDIATVSITVTPVNDAPIALNQTVVYLLNTPVNFALTAIDVDNAPGDLTFTVLTSPANGTLSGTAPNLTFTPDTGFTGSTSFTFKVNDGSLDSNIATVTINFNDGVNYAPVAEDQVVVVIEDQNKSILLGASDANGDPLTYIIVSNPAHGTLSQSGQTVIYTPDANYVGPDSFTFKVNDGTVDSNIATVSITVTPVNDAPVALNQTVIVQEDIAKVITLTGVDVENSPLVFTVLTQPTHGTLSGSGNTWTYTPDPEYTGPDGFTFKVNDGLLDSNMGTITINVVPVNDPPVAVDDKIITTNEDVAVTFSVIANDTDIDGFVDGSTVDLNPATPAEDKTFTVPGEGTYTVDNAGNVTFTPALNFNGLATAINYTVKDNEGGLSNVAQIQINVLPVNDAPLAINQVVTVQEDEPKLITLTGSDVENSPLTFTVLTQPTNGTLSGSGAAWTYTPNTDYVGPDSFTFKVNDGALDSNIGTISINVVPVNDPPVAVNDLITSPEDIVAVFNITDNDTDSDGDINPATVDLDPTTPAEDKTFTVAGEGTYSVDNLGNVTFTPELNYNGTTTPVAYTVKDDGGALSNIATIQIIVTPVNDPPVVVTKTVDVNEDESIIICFEVTDVENDPAVFTGGTATHGTVVAAPDSGPLCFLYTPNPDYNGPDQVLLTVCDANALTVCSAGTININVIPVNDPPRIIKEGVSVDKITKTTPEDTPLTFCFDVVDPDGDNYSVSNIVNVSGGGTLVATAAGLNELCFTFTPAPDFNGLSTWSITICDDATPSLCGTFTIEIDVTPVNDAPVANNQNVSVPEDTPTVIPLAGTDVDEDELTYTIITPPQHGTVTVNGGNVTYTPNENYIGNDSFTYKANDGIEDSNVAVVSIIVTPVNDAPVISPIPVITTPEDTPIQICIGASDLEGDPITYQTPVNVSGGGTMVPSTEFDFCYLYTPAKDFNGTAFWKFTVCDSGTPSMCTEVTVEILVTPVNDPPIAVNDFITAESFSETTPVNILANDIDVDNDPLVLTVTPLAGPFHGTVTMNADGSFTYKSIQGYMGADSVRYQVCDTGTPSLCDEGVVFIEVGPAKFKIYNGLSPNGDGLNDYWRIDGIEAYPNNKVKVFDRYNNLIFEMAGYNNDEKSWKGQTNHSMISGNVSEGTYFYSLDLGDGSELYSGYVVLKKN